MNQRNLRELNPYWKEKRVLVTGASGFIGSYLCQALSAVGVKQLTLLKHHRPAPAQQPVHAEWVELDLENRDEVKQALGKRRFDFVFHLAGKIDQAVGDQIYQRQFSLHTLGTLNLVEALEECGLERFIHVGSNAEYGNAPCPHDPATREMPNSAYGVSKLAASKLVAAKALSEGFPAVVVRPFLVYGEGQSAKSFLSRAMAAAVCGEKFPTTQGEQTRDFVPVAKVCDDLLRIAIDPQLSGGQVVNSCTGVETHLRDVLELLKTFYPAFEPVYGAIPYRETELVRSVGTPYRALTRDEAMQALRHFLGSKRSATSPNGN